MALTRERLGSLLTSKNLPESKVLPPTFRLKKHLAACGGGEPSETSLSVYRSGGLSHTPGCLGTGPTGALLSGFCISLSPGRLQAWLGLEGSWLPLHTHHCEKSSPAVYTGAGCSLRRTGAKREKDVERAATCQENRAEGSLAGGTDYCPRRGWSPQSYGHADRMQVRINPLPPTGCAVNI